MTDNGSSLVVAQQPGELLVSDIPAIVTECGAGAKFAWEEFFLGTVRNAHTRKAYLQAVRRFLAWCESVSVELPRITPGMMGQYLDELPVSTPSKKLHLAAIRSFLDVLVQRHVIVLNPALSVRAPRYSALEGKTPEITVPQCRALLASIRLNTAIDYRDRAIIAVLIYTAARVGAVARLQIKDFQQNATQFALRFDEKGGKSRLIPVRSNLELFIKEYLAVAGPAEPNKQEPLFRTADGRSGRLTPRAMSAIDMCRMVKRRLKDAGIETAATSHSFRSCTATDLLRHGTALEDVQHLLGHSDSRVTKLYDRRQQQVTRNIVERISV
jgi:site-specific recombinase XerD